MLRHFVKHSNKTHTRLIVDLLYRLVSYLMVEVYHAVLDNLLCQRSCHIVKSYAVLFLPADECPDDKYLNKYVRERVCTADADKWQDLGIVLMGQDAIYVLDIIRINHPNYIEECCLRMFTVWRQRTPKAS